MEHDILSFTDRDRLETERRVDIDELVNRQMNINRHIDRQINRHTVEYTYIIYQQEGTNIK